MRWLNETQYFVRHATRFGAYARAKKSGASDDEARSIADARHPPNVNDVRYEELVRTRGAILPWGSALALVYAASYPLFVSAQGSAEGDHLTRIAYLGWGLASLGWAVVYFGIFIGRFLIFDL